MNKTSKAGLTLATFLWAAGAHAQSTPSTIPVAGAGANAPVTGNAGQLQTNTGTAVAPANSPLQNQQNAQASQTQAQAAQAQAAQDNAVQANPGQPNQVAPSSGVFGPSAGPGIFGPAAQPMTTDIYGNQQPVSGTVQTAPGVAPMQQPSGISQTRPQNPIRYDANGQPIQQNLYPQADVPRSVHPITPSGTQLNQPTQTQPSGTVTGR